MHLGRRIVETPGLTGSSLLEARREADRYGLMVLVTSGSPRWTAELSARLRVVAQTPRTGTLVRRRCVICLVVDGGAGDRAALGIGGPGPYEDAVELAPRPQRWGCERRSHGGCL